eukprot:Nk52_evm21s367 gene=Nk52_evmTU21s367
MEIFNNPSYKPIVDSESQCAEQCGYKEKKYDRHRAQVSRTRKYIVGIIAVTLLVGYLLSCAQLLCIPGSMDGNNKGGLGFKEDKPKENQLMAEKENPSAPTLMKGRPFPLHEDRVAFQKKYGNEMWLTFFNKGRFDLAYVSIKAAIQFSTRPVLVFCVDCKQEDIPWIGEFDERVYVHHLPHRKEFSIYFAKLTSIILADSLFDIQRGAIIESDTIVTPAVDRIWDMFQSFEKLIDYPVMARHPNVGLVNQHIKPLLSNPMRQLLTRNKEGKIEPSSYYGHAHVLWHKESVLFIKNLVDKVFNKDKPFDKIFNDEVALNVMTQIHLHNHPSMPWIQPCLYDPFHATLPYLLTQKGAYPDQPIWPVAYYYMHGSKNAEEAAGILRGLEEMKKKNHKKYYALGDSFYDSEDPVFQAATNRHQCIL